MKHKILLSIFTLLFAASAFAGNTVDLSSLTDNYVAQDKDVLTGTLDGKKQPYKISIADGATVTLNGVTIKGEGSWKYEWAGINCLGDCEIVLANKSKNSVKGFYQEYPGIYVPRNRTLTISGTGSLDASSNGRGAGIGGGYGYGHSCGNIVISGGTVTATGGENAAGIGGGYQGTVGNIEITDGVTKVIAIKGENAPYTIGNGDGGSMGSVKIASRAVNNMTISPFEFPKGTYTVVFDANGGSGTMTDQVFYRDVEFGLEANLFLREDFYFAGWNTKIDGSGIKVFDQSWIYNLAEAGESITLYAQWSDTKVVNLDTLTADYVAQDGEVLMDTLDGKTQPYKVSIADGATVTFDGVTIRGVRSSDYRWAGISCIGNCEIVLAPYSVNMVKGFDYDYPGIYVPQSKTLTISGTGSLDASSNGIGAGIGGGYRFSCGNIVISGGTITATGGKYAAGIGAGYNSNVGNITITDGVTKVTAIKGEEAPYSIGRGKAGISGGSITIASLTTHEISKSPWIFTGETYTVAFDANGGSGTMTEQALYPDVELPLNANEFTREGLHFAGWNTKADGSGERIVDQAWVDNLAEVGETITLYAQWSEVKTVSLAALTDKYVAKNGEVLVGKLGGNYMISIEDGATVTFDGVTIDGEHSSGSYNWAGVTCLGNCNIILADNSVNTVNGFYESYPGIYVPEKNTLTISGTGSLDARAGGNYAAGIGAGDGTDGDCGNIVISGGSITATGGAFGAGIGGGYDSDVGNITITDDVTKVTAIKGSSAPYSVGMGYKKSKSGVITIGSFVSEDITTSPYTYTGSVYTIVFDANDGSLRTKNQVATYGYNQRLSVNAYTREGFHFVGWNTEPNGSGMAYVNGHEVMNLAEVGETITLYAQWSDDGRIYLSGLAGNYEAQDGDVLTGVLEGSVSPYKISIANGATVTLDGVTINGVDDAYSWAGITCVGDCDIVLAQYSMNMVKGFNSGSGIYVPVGKTLTISGLGSLEASSNGRAAGIGGGAWDKCGNIVIDGGTVTAIGGEGAAGIGGGYNATIGSITITDNVTKVTAIKGKNAFYSVGIGEIGLRTGDITIGTEVRKDITESPFVHLRLLTVTAKNKTISYGDEPADDGVEYAGFLSGDDASVLGGNLMFSTDYKQYGNVGEYDITPYGLTSDNYNIVYKSGTLTVEPKNVGDYAAVQVFEDENGSRAEINGEYNGMDAVAIDKKITDVTVAFNREFLKDTYSTMVLPFSVKTEKISGLNAVLYYNGIGKDANNNDAIRMKVLWAKDGVINDDKGDPVSYKDTVMKANTPYLVLMGSETFEVDGPVTIEPTAEAATELDGWKFRGVWEYKKWEEGNKELGYAYGFAASAPKDSKIKVGDFVKIGEGTYIYPLRAYLVSSNIPDPVQSVRANGAYAKRPTVAQKELPELMSVIVDGLGDNGNGTTVIGQFNTRTGEFKMNYDRGKFDLKGRRVNGTNNARGAYYGKKTLKK